MYFLSALDPNYRIKGSRDPLGFQSLWAAAGHKAIKHLSTVSSNLNDFMILCYGIYFYGDRDPRGFIRFFIKFEQVCAYARRIHNKETSFNGIEFINKKVTDNKFYISLKDTILSNQRAYGIYGKYIRPLRDMKITEDEQFSSIIEKSISKTDKNALSTLLSKLLKDVDTRIVFQRDDLIPIAALLSKVTDEEQQLYSAYILKSPGDDHPQNNLYEVIKNNTEITQATFQLHQIIQSILSTQEIDEALKNALINIDYTDKVLHPLNLIFTHLLSRSIWTEDEIKAEPIFRNLSGKVNYDFHDETMRGLNEMLAHPILELVGKIIDRNEEVSKARGNKAWIEKERNTYRILYGENGRQISEIDTDTGYGFTYFLNNYLHLFKQIEMI